MARITDMHPLARMFPTVVLAWSKIVRWRPSWPRFIPQTVSLGSILVWMAILGMLSAVSASYWRAYAERAAIETHWASIGIEIYTSRESHFKNLWAFRQDLTDAGNVTQWQLEADLNGIMICECKIHDDQLAGIDQFPELIGLHLKDTTTSDEVIQHIVGCRHLKYLSLTNTQVTPAGAERLSQIESLEEFSVDGQPYAIATK